MNSEKLNAALNWSYLSPKPIFVHHKKYDAHLVFWNGIVITKTYATMIIASKWMNIFFGNSQKEAAWDEYNRLYRLGAFGHHKWDAILNRHSSSSMLNYLTTLVAFNKTEEFDVVMKPEFSRLTIQYSPAEAMEWALQSNETVIDDVA